MNKLKLACLLFLLLLPAACSGPLSRTLLPVMPIHSIDPRWGAVKPGDSLVLESDRHFAEKNRRLKRQADPGDLMLPAGFTLQIRGAGTSRTSESPAFAVQAVSETREYEILLPMADKRTIFHEGVLRSGGLRLVPAVREGPAWAWW